MANIVISGIFILISIAIFLETRGFSSYEYSIMNSASFPRGLAVLMILFSVILLGRGISEIRSGTKAEPLKGNPPTLLGLLAVLITTGYVILIRLFGFMISTAVVLVAYALILKRGKFHILDTVIIPAVGLTLVGVMFYFLKIPFFKGVLF